MSNSLTLIPYRPPPGRDKTESFRMEGAGNAIKVLG